VPFLAARTVVVASMGIIEDILNALDRIPIWKRVQELPPEVDALKKRVADLEQKLGGKWPPDICKFCGARALRLSATLGPTDKGKIREHWHCEECSKTEVRLV
jgi:hypothetical protein